MALVVSTRYLAPPSFPKRKAVLAAAAAVLAAAAALPPAVLAAAAAAVRSLRRFRLLGSRLLAHLAGRPRPQ
jgi:hypothetical protein